MKEHFGSERPFDAQPNPEFNRPVPPEVLESPPLPEVETDKIAQGMLGSKFEKLNSAKF